MPLRIFNLKKLVKKFNFEMTKRNKYTIEQIADIFKEGGCVLTADEYKVSSVPISYTCSCGNTSQITLCNFKRGVRCRKCCGSEIWQNDREARWDKNKTAVPDCIWIKEVKDKTDEHVTIQVICYERSN